MTGGSKSYLALNSEYPHVVKFLMTNWIIVLFGLEILEIQPDTNHSYPASCP